MENDPGIAVFDLLIRGGAFLSLVGLVGLVWCIIFVAKARRSTTSEDELRAKLRKALPLNLGSLFTSVLGLMLIILGIFLG